MRHPAALLFTILLATTTAQAQVIWDFGPASGTPDGSWLNTSTSQNFADDFSFPVAMELTGMDIWTPYSSGSPTVHIRLMLDNGAGDPGSVVTEWDQGYTSWVPDSGFYKVSADFPPVLLDANQVYWIGMSGSGWDLGQTSISPSDTPGDGTMAQFSGSTFTLHTGVGDQMYQLRGQQAARIPVLGPLGIATLVVLLSVAGWVALKRA